jgi:Carboxypeptidase regulatory-like domain
MQSISRLLAGVLALVLSLAGTVAYGQGGATGAISGVVVDTSGGSIASAELQIVDARTEVITRKLPTGADGTFTATLLPPGTYYVLVNKQGFTEARASNIEVRVTETTRLTITLKPGSVTEKVEISAQVTSVETTNATTGQSLGTDTVRELPLATQNFQQLLTLSTGAQSELNASAQLGRGDVRIIVNGQREDNNNYLIEGITATDYNVAELTNTPLPNPDVIQEFKVQTSLYDASQGRNGGGNVNAILKSGTKDFHGDAYEFFRNDVLNANDFFLNRAGQPRPVVKQNIFGGSMGGPVGTEKWGFFFGNYQGTRQRSGDSPGTLISTSIPVLPQLRDAGSISQAFFGNTTTPIDSVALALLQAKGNQFGGGNGGFLIPSIPGTVGQFAPFAFSSPGKYTDNQFTANWDREFRNARDKVSSRFFFSNFESDLPFGAGGLTASLGGSIAPSDLNFPYKLPVHSRFFSAAETHLFSPTLVNEFRFGFVHINNSAINNTILKASDLGINRPTNNVTQAIYKFTFFTSGFQIGPTPQADQFQTQNNYNFVDTVSWVTGKHVLRFGGDFTRVNLDKLFPQVFNGQLFYANSAASGATPAFTDVQNFLLGNVAFNFGGGGVFNHEYRQNNFSEFVQDDYKIRHDLTLNLGLRVEELGAFYDNLYHIGNVDPALANQGKYPFIYPKGVNGYNVAGLTGTASSTTLKNNYATGWGPRVGLAYDLFGKHTTTIRAGYGIYYVREDVGAVDQLSFQAPFDPIVFFPSQPGISVANFFSGTPATNINSVPAGGVLSPLYVPVLSQFQGFTGSNTALAPIYNGTSINLFALQVPQHFVVPNTQQWNLTMQRSLAKQWVLEVGYVGTHAVHLRETSNNLQSAQATPANPIKLSGPLCNPNPCVITQNTIANAPARSLAQGINGYSGFEYFADDAYSHYNSLQTTVSRRWNAGYFQAAYTFARSTDVASTGNTAFITIFNNQNDFRTSRGLSDFDRKHRLVVSYRYDLPFGKGATGFKKAAFADWAISGITIFQSGLPFSVVDSLGGQAFVGVTTVTVTGNLAQGQNVSNGLSHGSVQSRLGDYLNPAAFTVDPPLPAAQGGDGIATAFGNLGRNTYRGPSQQNWDFSLLKDFKLTERQSLRFATDFFNIWNHANFANPSVTDVETVFCTPNVNGCPSSGLIPNSPFGAIVATKGTPRLIQFSLRYAF